MDQGLGLDAARHLAICHGGIRQQASAIGVIPFRLQLRQNRPLAPTRLALLPYDRACSHAAGGYANERFTPRGSRVNIHVMVYGRRRSP